MTTSQCVASLLMIRNGNSIWSRPSPVRSGDRPGA